MEKRLREFLIELQNKTQERVADTYWDIEEDLEELFESIEFLTFKDEEVERKVYH